MSQQKRTRSLKSPRKSDTSSAVDSIRRVVRVLRLAAQKTQTTAGISSAQLFVLQQLGDGDGLSVNELAKRTLTDRSSVAALVERLQEQQLVDRTTHPADRRRAVVRITGAGRRLLGQAPDAPTTALLAALRRLDRRELATLARSLRNLSQAMGAAEEPVSMLFAEDPATRAPRRGTRSVRERRSRAGHE